MTMKIIKATDPADLVQQVKKNLDAEFDLHTPMFVGDGNLLCQRMVPLLRVYEYALIVANDLDDLEAQEGRYIRMGFDYLYSTVMWCGKYLQWMCCMNMSGMTIKNAVVGLAMKDITAAPRADELKLVEDVQEVLRMAPAADGRLVARIPFPLEFS